MYNLLIEECQQVKAKITNSVATNVRYKFENIPNIAKNNIMLYGIEAFTQAQLKKDDVGNDLITAAASVNVVVTLKDTNNNEFVYQMPMTALVRSNNGGFVVMVKPRKINLTECYVQLVDTTGVTVNQVCSFNFYYRVLGN